MIIVEDILDFQPPTHFRYATRDGSLPVNGFGGEMFLGDREGGLLVRYQGGFFPRYFGTGWLFRRILRAAQKSAFRALGKAYEVPYGTEGTASAQEDRPQVSQDPIKTIRSGKS